MAADTKPRIITDAMLRTLKYKPQASNGEKNKGQLLGNRYPDRDGMYVFVSPGGGISFRHDFRDPTPPEHKRQCVVYGRYYSGEGEIATRIASIGTMLDSIRCSSTSESEAIGAAKRAIAKAVEAFKGTPGGPVRKARVIPLLTLEEARDAHRAFRRQLSMGLNPLAHIKEKQENASAEAALPTDFKSVAERWYAKNIVKDGVEKSASWKRANRRYLDAAYPFIGNRHVQEIKPEAISAVITPVERSGRAMTSEKMRQCYAMVFDHAAGKEFLMGDKPNPARVLSVDLPETKHFAHLDITDVPAFLKKVDEDTATEPVRIAVRLLFLCLTRKMELCGARWSEIDLDAGRWLIPAERMKEGKPHIVPLSRQAVTLFRRLKELSNGSDFVFPHRDHADRCIGPDTLRKAYVRSGYAGKATPHGCRSTASSTLNELGYRPDAIERQLAHTEENESRASYLHTDFMLERRRMLQDWADAIDRICAGQPLVVAADNVVQLQPKAA